MCWSVGICQLFKSLWYTVCTSTSYCTRIFLEAKSTQCIDNMASETSKKYNFMNADRGSSNNPTYLQFVSFNSLQRPSPKKAVLDI